jgi:hypothetical protein
MLCGRAFGLPEIARSRKALHMNCDWSRVTPGALNMMTRFPGADVRKTRDCVHCSMLLRDSL